VARCTTEYDPLDIISNEAYEVNNYQGFTIDDLEESGSIEVEENLTVRHLSRGLAYI
jgi:hypothetical protein